MVTTIQTKIYKVTLLLLLALCLGGTSKLYAAQNDNVDEKKEDIPDTAQDTSPNGADNEATNKAEAIPNWQADWAIDWSCKSIEECKAVITIMGCLEYWQKITNDIEQLGQVFKYLSASNNYRDILSAYHHVLDKHLNGKGNKEAFQFINSRLQQHITCNFAKCKGYDRNQQDRGKEKVEKDEIAQYGEAAIFIRDTLDTIHAYLVHGSDSGHRYSPSKHKPHKVHKQPKDAANDDEKESDKATASYTLFDQEMAALQKWQEGIKKQRRNQTKTKFITKVDEVKKNEVQKMSLALLKAKFGQEKAFIVWLGYLKDKQCDTDCILEEIDMHNVGTATVIPIDHILFDRIKKYIQDPPADSKKTASYGFGVRLYYWDECKNSKKYVAPTYPSFKNEMLAKKDISISKWNQKMYVAKLMLAQSATLKRLKAADSSLTNSYGIQKGVNVSIWHLLSIMFYTNFTALCTAFGESLRYLSNAESLQALIKRNSKWYYLSRYLREVVECFGTQIGSYGIRRDIYYHGVSYLLFTQFSVYWYGPLSTSKQMEVATLFTSSGNNGLLLELKEDSQYLRFFNVSLLSCFGSEDERLFIGGRYPIQIATIRLLKDDINLQQIMHALFIVHSIISGKNPGRYDEALPVDAVICKELIEAPSKLPLYAQKIWNGFRDQQQRITIYMEGMYKKYQAFIPLLFDPKVKNLLGLDKIPKLFPNITEITCESTDYDEEKIDKYGDKGEYSADIVSSNFILGVKDRLSKVDKQAKLTKLVIQTDRVIKDSCKLYAPQFGALGWKIGKGCNDKTIVLTKQPYDVIYKDVIPKISAIIQGEAPSDSIPPSLDVPIFKQLMGGSKDIPADVQKKWNAFRHQQQCITIRMYSMHLYYRSFIPILSSSNPKLKNVLLLDKIVQLFPNIAKIICRDADHAVYEDDDKYGYVGYSSSIVSSNFMLGIKDRLTKMDKQAKLTKIIIQTYRNEIKADCKLYATQFGTLGWQVGKGTKTIVVTKEPYEVRYKDAILKIKSMIQGEASSYEATSLDALRFYQLITGEKDVPANVQQIWNQLRHQQQCITINMEYMYRFYKAFIPLFCSPNPKLKNLLLLDQIAQLFPNATEIICKNTDYVGKHAKEYSSDGSRYSSYIVCSNFILGVKERLSKMDKHTKLTKIVMQTSKYKIKDDCNLYPTQFGILGWQVQKGSYKDKWGGAYKNCQIALTRLKKPNASFPNRPPALSKGNENKGNHHQLADNAVFDLD